MGCTYFKSCKISISTNSHNPQEALNANCVIAGQQVNVYPPSSRLQFTNPKVQKGVVVDVEVTEFQVDWLTSWCVDKGMAFLQKIWLIVRLHSLHCLIRGVKLAPYCRRLEKILMPCISTIFYSVICALVSLLDIILEDVSQAARKLFYCLQAWPIFPSNKAHYSPLLIKGQSRMQTKPFRLE